MMLAPTLSQNPYQEFSDTVKMAARGINKTAAIEKALILIKNTAITPAKITGDDFCNATKTGNIELLNAIIAKGVNVNITDFIGYTPVFYAQNIKTIDILHANKADIFRARADHFDPLNYMRSTGRNRDVIQHLKKLLDFSKQEKDNFYKNIKELISRELAVAKAQGKNLLIILGERHYVYPCHRVENIIIQAALELGINNLYDECTQEDIQQILKHPAPDYGSKLLRKFANKKMNVEGLDPYHSLAEDAIEGNAVDIRNLGTSEEVRRRKKNAVMIVGDAHLKGLLMDKNSTLSERQGAPKQFHIVPISLSRVIGIRQPKLTDHEYELWEQYNMTLSEGSLFAKNRDYAIQIGKHLTFVDVEAQTVIARWNVIPSKLDIKEQSEAEYQPSAKPPEDKDKAEKLHLDQQKREQEVKEKSEREAKEMRELELRWKDHEAKERSEREQNDKKFALELQKQFERESQDEINRQREAKRRAHEEAVRQAEAKRKSAQREQELEDERVARALEEKFRHEAQRASETAARQAEVKRRANDEAARHQRELDDERMALQLQQQINLQRAPVLPSRVSQEQTDAQIARQLAAQEEEQRRRRLGQYK